MTLPVWVLPAMKGMTVNNLKPFFPPRPGVTLFHPFLKDYSSKDWLAQRKFKGQRNLIYVRQDRKVELWSRHPQNKFQHGNYELSLSMKSSILELDLPDTDVVIDSELLHAKTKGVKDIVVVYDVLYIGQYLGNEIQTARLDILQKICRNPTELEPGQRGLLVNQHVWMAETIQDDFPTQYRSMLDCPEIEGLVLRRRNSRLRDGNPSLGRIKYEVPWMIRVRKPEKGYHH